MSLSIPTVATIANNYADVIEGGRPYMGPSGTIHIGVPALGAEDDDQIFSVLTSIEAAAGSSESVIVTAVDYPALYPGLAGRITPSGAAYEAVYPHFLVGMNGAGNANNHVARRIVAWPNTSAGLLRAFPDTVTVGSLFKPMLGFRRAPDNVDLEAADAPGAWDRFFSIEIMPGKRDGWWGNDVEHYRTQLVVRVRFLKKSRARRVLYYALQNMLSIRSALCKPESRDPGGLVQQVSAEDTEPEQLIEDNDRIVMIDRLTMVYRIDATHR